MTTKQIRLIMNDRRDHVPFDAHFFEKKAAEGQAYSAERTFRHIYRTNHWAGDESVSGEGADRRQTRHLEAALPALLASLPVDVFLDLPCGDYGWMQFVELPVARYIGGDIVPDLVTRNQERFGDATHRFVHLDLCEDSLPAADLMLCRDALVHLSFADIHRALGNVRRSHITYLLTTTFAECPANEDITTGDWRPLNLQRPPFNLPAPLQLLDERCTEGGGQYRDKSLGLWRVRDVPRPASI